MLFKNKNQKPIEDMTREEYREVVSLETAYVLADSIDEKMGYKRGRTRRLVELIKEMCKRLNKDEEFTTKMVELALIHDAGMIMVPDEILLKNGELDDVEKEILNHHVIFVEDEIINAHHERYDGKGFPNGLEEKEIPYEARFLAVADAYISMTSNRPFRAAMSQGEVRGELMANKVSQFDPVIADVVIEIIDDDPWYKLREE